MSGTSSTPPSGARRGKIATFFSFKGGVGRTMAVANCAFLAAMSGARVLVIDFDLEAPGLPYYFRALTDPRGRGDIRRSHGLLDLFWGWQQAVEGASKGLDLEKRLRPYRRHDIFKRSAQPLVESSRLPGKARLDVITAGSPFIDGPEEISYADALAKFSWSNFFDENAGGNLIHHLGEWCRENYDLTLIDSRTGLADVAGICTMQIPDAVYLSFVFNRQNIDGSAQVAKSILAARGSEIDVRIVPMRVAKERTTEESDARSRASRDFKRAGLAAVDLDSLSVPATPGVPYYEALAPFYSSEPAEGDLNVAYRRLTRDLLGRDLKPLQLELDWVEEVRQRLKPRISTVDYLSNLAAADPDRAFEESERFLDGALDADPATELEPDYVRTLIRSVLHAFDGVDVGEDAKGLQLESKILTLIEQMHLLGEEDWRSDFVSVVQDFNFRLYREGDGHRLVLNWLERVLSEGPQNPGVLISRADTAIQLAHLSKDRGDRRTALLEAEFAEHFGVTAELIGAHDIELRRIRAQIGNLRARIALPDDMKTASVQFQVVLDEVGDAAELHLRALAASAHLELAKIDPDRRQQHYLAAAELEPRTVLRDAELLWRIVGSLTEDPKGVDQALWLAKSLFGDEKKIRSLPHFSQNAFTAQQFAKSASRLLQLLSYYPSEEVEHIALNLTDTGAKILTQWSKRARSRPSSESGEEIQGMAGRFEALADSLQVFGLDERLMRRLRNALDVARAGSDEG